MKNKTGQFLKTARKNQNKTQLDVSKACGYPNPQFTSPIDNGHSKLPLSIIEKYCTFLTTDIKEIKRKLITDYESEINANIKSKNSRYIKSNK